MGNYIKIFAKSNEICYSYIALTINFEILCFIERENLSKK